MGSEPQAATTGAANAMDDDVDCFNTAGTLTKVGLVHQEPKYICVG